MFNQKDILGNRAQVSRFLGFRFQIEWFTHCFSNSFAWFWPSHRTGVWGFNLGRLTVRVSRWSNKNG